MQSVSSCTWQFLNGQTQVFVRLEMWPRQIWAVKGEVGVTDLSADILISPATKECLGEMWIDLMDLITSTMVA